jgi:hypothetical protein
MGFPSRDVDKVKDRGLKAPSHIHARKSLEKGSLDLHLEGYPKKICNHSVFSKVRSPMFKVHYQPGIIQ